MADVVTFEAVSEFNLIFHLTPDQVRFIEQHCFSATTGSIIPKNFDDVMTIDIPGLGRVVADIKTYTYDTDLPTRATSMAFILDKCEISILDEMRRTNKFYLLSFGLIKGEDGKRNVVSFNVKGE